MPVDVSVLEALEAETTLDTFNYTAEAPISNGGLWTPNVLASDEDLNTDGSHAYTGASPGQAHTAFRNERTWGPDMAAMITVAAKNSTDNGLIGIFFGLATGRDGYRGEVRVRTTGDEWRIQRIDDDAETVLTSGTIQEISDGDKIAVVRVGSVIELWWKTGSSWTFIVDYDTSEDSPEYTAAGNVGLQINEIGDNGTLLDDLKVMDIEEDAPATYTLDAEAGSYAITGAAAILGHAVPSDAGVYAITGSAVTFKRGYALAAGTGSYAITGADATLDYSAVTEPGPGHGGRCARKFPPPWLLTH